MADEKVTMAKALNMALDQEMKRDSRVIVMGEDVGIDGGVFRVTEGLIDKYEAGYQRKPEKLAHVTSMEKAQLASLSTESW